MSDTIDLRFPMPIDDAKAVVHDVERFCDLLGFEWSGLQRQFLMKRLVLGPPPESLWRGICG